MNGKNVDVPAVGEASLNLTGQDSQFLAELFLFHSDSRLAILPFRKSLYCIGFEMPILYFSGYCSDSHHLKDVTGQTNMEYFSLTSTEVKQLSSSTLNSSDRRPKRSNVRFTTDE